VVYIEVYINLSLTEASGCKQVLNVTRGSTYKRTIEPLNQSRETGN